MLKLKYVSKQLLAYFVFRLFCTWPIKNLNQITYLSSGVLDFFDFTKQVNLDL